MSVDTFLVFPDERLPEQHELQTAMDGMGAEIVLEPLDDLREHAGFWPAEFKGHRSGFEWYYDSVISMLGEESWAAGYTNVAQFVTFSDMRELICALYVAGVLAKLTDGRVYDEETDGLIDGDRVLQLARDIEKSEL